MSVTIGGNVYEIYGSLANASVYMLAASHASATWAAASADGKAAALVTATRTLDRKPWAGAPVSAPPVLAWPRTGVTYASGAAVSSTAVPIQIEWATYELAALVLIDAAGSQTSLEGSLVQSAGAGGATVSFFGPTRGKAFPSAIVDELVAQFLGGGVALSGITVSGTDEDSQFDTCDTYRLRR